MGADTINLVRKAAPSLQKALTEFFASNTTASTKNKLWHLFKAWGTQQNQDKQHTPEDIALFLDQLINLVSAAQQQHEENRANPSVHQPKKEGRP